LTHLLNGHNVAWTLGASLFMASIQAPIVEEILFRGTLLPAISGLFQKSGARTALGIGISSLLFASIHPQGFVLWLPIAGIGVINGILCYQTRSVLPGIFMHGMFNGALLIINLINK
jgi:membrane protease YdiL (CAAX protease family)